MKPSIAIVGCGWLGLPLAKKLIQLGYPVSGSTTTPEKIAVLQESQIDPFLIKCGEEQVEGNWEAFFSGKEIVIIDIPPKLRGKNRENFVAKIQTLISCIVTTTVTKVLFVSSTSVYSDTNTTVTEATIPQPDTESGKQLLEAENYLLENPNLQTTIVRFGGLIGNDRNPVKFLAGKENIENPEAPINFIHQTDCIGILLAIIEKEIWNETFNAVAPSHPTREAYYTRKAFEFGLPLPQFNHEKPSSGKSISSEKVQHLLEYEFQIPEL